MTVSDELYTRLEQLGITNNNVRNSNIGNSDYSKHIIQPWSIWLDYNLDPWDADIIKRVLRTKEEPGKTKEESRILDYQKIIHICKEKLRQLGVEDSSKKVILNTREIDRLLEFLGEDDYTEIVIEQKSSGIGEVTKVTGGNKEQDITDYYIW